MDSTTRPLPPDALEPLPAQDAFRRHARKAFQLFFLGVFLDGLTIGYLNLVARASSTFAAIGFGGGTLLVFLGFVRGVRALLLGRGTGKLTLVVLFPVLGGLFLTAVGAMVALFATSGFTRGRQLRRFGRALLPPVVPGSGWSAAVFAIDAPVAEASALARQWRENGRTEHASVAAFARLTLDLIALGAPARLVAQAQRDALDEIRHAELCFSVAHALDGQDERPGEFPEAQRVATLHGPRTLALAQLAVDSLVDGALHEGLSARIVAKLTPRCEVPAISSVLKEIAADEGRHAAHGWDVVEWCLLEGGAWVAQALTGAQLALPTRLRNERVEAAHSGRWEPFGIHGRALEEAEYVKMQRDVRRILQGMLQARMLAA